jgi:hypothetical protein
LFGGIVGADMEAGSQVAVNMINGDSFGKAVSNIDGGKVLASAAVGAATGGLSVVKATTTLARTGKAVGLIGGNVAEGVAHNAIDGNEITASSMAIDATVGVAGAAASSVATSAARNSNNGQRLEGIATRAESRANRAPSNNNQNQSDRARRASDNHAANRGNPVGTATTKGVSVTGAAVNARDSNANGQTVITNSNSSTPADNTRVSIPFRRN